MNGKIELMATKPPTSIVIDKTILWLPIGMIIPNIWENKIDGNQTTNQMVNDENMEIFGASDHHGHGIPCNEYNISMNELMTVEHGTSSYFWWCLSTRMYGWFLDS